MTDKNGKKVNPFDVLGSAMGGGSKPTGGTAMNSSAAKSTTSP